MVRCSCEAERQAMCRLMRGVEEAGVGHVEDLNEGEKRRRRLVHVEV